MKTTRVFLLGGLVAASMGGAAIAQTIANSPHDLSSSVATNADKNEICVYCHTPHAANTAISAPLWNKPAGSATLSSYSSSTIDSEILPVGSVSLACLSCHDGTQAPDTVINAPGTNGLTAGTSLGTAATALTGVFNIGGDDLVNDHPIGIRYGGGDGGSLAANDPDFVTASTATINSTPVWWVDTSVGSAGTREKTDMILYTRTSALSSNPEPYVECASCHDPHAGDTDDTTGGTNIAGSDVSFMRISNDSSAVCLACHIK